MNGGAEMYVRGKLIEILRKPIFPHELVDQTEAVADYLLDSGVTVQEWVSVKDGLPERTGSYIVCTDKGAICMAKFYSDLPTGLRYENPHWNNSRLNKHITHWCHLPQPPKGE